MNSNKRLLEGIKARPYSDKEKQESDSQVGRALALCASDPGSILAMLCEHHLSDTVPKQNKTKKEKQNKYGE